MKNIKVSVVVPVYNVEPYLDRTMESLLKQTLKEIEIIMVDDESPDNCPAICDQYANKYSNIKVIHKKNAGLGMACNSGIEVATGEYIAFCDSDDYVDSNMYETMYNTAAQYDADAVFSGIKTINQNGKVCPMNSYHCFQIIKNKNDISNFAMDMIASKPSDSIERHIAMSAKIVLYRKEIIDKNNLRFVSERQLISEDLIWNLDILCHSSCIITLPHIFYYYYSNTNSLSKQIRTDKFKFFKSIREALLEQTERNHFPQEIKLRIDKMFIGYSRSYIGKITNSTLPYKQKKQIISDICNDLIWEKIWQTYPIFKMPKKHLLIIIFMKYKLFFFISLIYKLKK